LHVFCCPFLNVGEGRRIWIRIDLVEVEAFLVMSAATLADEEFIPVTALA
jgi:hypothetical protein